MLTTKIEIIGNEPEKTYAQTVSLEHQKNMLNFTPFIVAELCQNGFWETSNCKRF